jgi:hypothetical protein
MALISPLKPDAAWVAAAVFGALGVFASWLGLLDFLSAASLQYKLIGFAFAMAGLVLLAGSAVLARDTWRRKRGRVAAVVAGVAGVFVGGYLLMRVRGGGYLFLPGVRALHHIASGPASRGPVPDGARDLGWALIGTATQRPVGDR